MKRLQSVQPFVDAGDDKVESRHRADKFAGLRFLLTDEACDYLRYRGRHRLRSLYRFIERKGIRTARRCRRVLVLKADLDRAIGTSTK